MSRSGLQGTGSVHGVSGGRVEPIDAVFEALDEPFARDAVALLTSKERQEATSPQSFGGYATFSAQIIGSYRDGAQQAMRTGDMIACDAAYRHALQRKTVRLANGALYQDVA